MNLLFKDQKHKFIRQYELFQTLGYGSHGTVYRAIDYETGHPVAVKMYRAVHNGHWRSSLRPYFRRELDALYHFSLQDNRHENIIRIHDHNLVELDDNETVLWIILENMECDLSMRLRQMRERNEEMPVEEIRRIAFYVLRGIAHFHAKGFIHKDVNASNVLIGADEPTVKLADFSVALPTSALGIVAEQVGDIPYRPPEVMFRNAPHGPAGDMWGLGLLICEMTLGKKLFEGSSEIEVIHSMLGILGAPDLSTVPQDLLHIVLPFRDFDMSSTADDVPIKLHRIGCDGFHLLQQLLSLNWRERPTAQEVLQSQFFDRVRPGVQ